MRDVGQRLLIGIAAAAAIVMAVGYAVIAGRIAAPLGGDLGTFDVPATGARAVLLEDGRPAFLVATGDGAMAVDARAPHEPGAPGRLVAWCQLPPTGLFMDLVDGDTYDPDGTMRTGTNPEGLVRYATRSDDDGRRMTVESESRGAGMVSGAVPAVDCEPNRWSVHRPDPDEVFDPSVAAAEEPPGWIWLEGTLVARSGEALLCDGIGDACATGAAVRGIDPALIPAGDRRMAGHFIGRVRDNAIDDLNAVPSPGGTR